MRSYPDCDKAREAQLDAQLYIEFEVWHAGWWVSGKVVPVDTGFTEKAYEWQWLV